MIGENLRNLRKNRKMTITDLAEKANLTKSLISQIENNKANPSINTLNSISKALGVSIGSLFDNFKQVQDPVVKRENRKILRSQNGVIHYRLTPDLPEHSLELYQNEFEINGTTGPLYSHNGEECGIVLQGRLLVEYDGNNYILEDGDSIIINSSRPHRVQNINNGKTVVIWINTAPPPWKKGQQFPD